MEHLVVAFDASPAACSAAQWAFGLAALHRSRVSLVRVEPPGASSSEEARHRVRDAAVEQAQLALDAGRPPASVGFVDRPGGPSVDVAALVADLDADLVVVGTGDPGPTAPPAPSAQSGGTAPDGHVAHGSPDLVRTVRDVLGDGATPVAVIPIGTPPPDGRTHWLVAVDGSPADRATLWFARLATSTASGVGSASVGQHPRVTAVLTYQPSADTFPHPAEPAWTYPGELEARRHLDDVGPADVELRREPGPEAEALRRLATVTPTSTAPPTSTATPSTAAGPTSTGAGSVIVLAGDDTGGAGSRLARVHGLGRLAGGSTVEAVLAEVAVPVVIVPGRLGELAAAQAARAAADVAGRGNGHTPTTAPRTGADTETGTVGTVGSVAARVADAERRDGGDAGRRHIMAPPGAEPRGVGRIQANDHANLASVARPSARTAVLAGLALGALALVVSLVAGAGTMVATMVTIGATIVGLVLGGLGGLYRHVVMNRDVIDLRGAEDAPAAASATEHVATTRAAEGVGYVEEHDAQVRQARPTQPGGDRTR